MITLIVSAFLAATPIPSKQLSNTKLAELSMSISAKDTITCEKKWLLKNGKTFVADWLCNNSYSPKFSKWLDGIAGSSYTTLNFIPKKCDKRICWDDSNMTKGSVGPKPELPK
jgi:hypothetical protein